MAGGVDMAALVMPGLAADYSTPSGRTSAGSKQLEAPLPEKNVTEDPEAKREALNGVSDALNAVAKAVDRDLSFAVNEKTGDIVIKVSDGSTGEEIRSIPGDDVIKLKEALNDMAGILFDSVS